MGFGLLRAKTSQIHTIAGLKFQQNGYIGQHCSYVEGLCVAWLDREYQMDAASTTHGPWASGFRVKGPGKLCRAGSFGPHGSLLRS